MKPYDPDHTSHSIPQEVEEDPELAYNRMRTEARDLSRDMLPALYEKFLNASPRDAVTIFEAIANRGGFVDESTKNQQSSTTNVLQISGADFTNMLQGLKQITKES